MSTRKLVKKDSLGPYRILREIGRGGSGVVYEGWDPAGARKVALKVLPAIRALDEDRVQRFLREAQTVQRLHHESIVSLFEVGKEGGNYFLVMQYVEGRPLDVFWKEELIDFDASVRVVLQCLGALEHAHGLGIVHLDVKPQNILVDRSGKAFLTDFGLARGIGRGSGEPMAGTPKYMSPEQARGSADVDVRSDLYSLGVTLYNLLTYTHPFEGEDVAIILRNVISGEFPRPRDVNNRIPSRLEAIVLKAMERKPARRYQTAAEFRADLESYLKGEWVTASVPLSKWRGLRLLKARRALYGALLLALAAVGVLIVLETRTRRAPDPPPADPPAVEAARKAREVSEEGDRLFQAGRLDGALERYREALALVPGDPVTLVKRGQIHAQRGDAAAAEADFTE
ncbi:MAG: protein kinase, partial [Planctomycetes bacterium]|nr:protein kinase [Planctomycetota bacterium]